MTNVPYEDPKALLARLKLGREEYCQRLLTMLVLDGTYPPWNTRSTPSAEGVAFLRALDALSFGEERWAEPVVFVDELDLPPRPEDDRGGAPDYALIWDHRVWMIELKSERGSHRVDQLPSYLRLGAHHYPAASVDITYITPTMEKPAPALSHGQRYAHLNWDNVAPLVRQVWGGAGEPRVVRVRDGLLEAIASIELPVAEWRARLGAPAPVDVPAEAQGLRTALLTAEDGLQRVVDVPFEDLQSLHDLRVTLRDMFSGNERLRNVRPWVWSAATSGGVALSASGAEHGYELRLSRYANLPRP